MERNLKEYREAAGELEREMELAEETFKRLHSKITKRRTQILGSGGVYQRMLWLCRGKKVGVQGVNTDKGYTMTPRETAEEFVTYFASRSMVDLSDETVPDTPKTTQCSLKEVEFSREGILDIL